MKKISIISLHLGYGGAEQAVTSLANMLSKHYEVEIISTYKLYQNPSFHIEDNVKITYLINSDLPLKLAEYKILLKKRKLANLFKLLYKNYIKKFKIITMFKDFILGTKMMVFDRKSKLKKYLENSSANIIISSKEMYNEILGNINNDKIIKIGWEHNHHNNDSTYIEKVTNSAKNLDYLILVSKSLTDYYKDKLKDTNCEVIHISNVLDEIPKNKSSLSNKKLVSVGRLSKEKGYIDLLKIMKNLNNNEWTLDIIGNGVEFDSLNEYIKENKLTKIVKLHGFQSKEYINSILKESSIYLMTSHSESFGIVLIEAMSYNLPCIAYSSAIGATEVIKNNENGYLIESRNINEYLNKLNYLMNNQEERKRLGNNGYNSIQKYSKENVKKHWIKIIEGK